MSKMIDADILRRLMQKDEKELIDNIEQPLIRKIVKSVFDVVRYEVIYLETHTEGTERKGKWIHDGFDHPHGIDWCHCSICGNLEDMKSVYTNVHVYPYCAKCGAKMEVTE